MIRLDAPDAPAQQSSSRAAAQLTDYSTKLRGATIWDIETGPLPRKEIERVVRPFDESSVDQTKIPGYGEFVPPKTGNLKPENAKVKVDEALAEFKKAKAVFAKTLASAIAEAREAYWSNVTERAALSAITGRVLAVGFWCSAENTFEVLHNDRSEANLLRAVWSRLDRAQRNIGFHTSGFDLPFLYRRSLILGVGIPAQLLDRNRYWLPKYVDLLEVWQAGTRDNITLDELSRALGGPGKNGSAADFAATWKADREAAVAYLRNDIEMTLHVAERLVS